MAAATPVRRFVNDVATLKALADPTRMTALELLMSDPGRAWTAKALADRIGMPPTKLYYHLNLLERQELVRVGETRIVNGIIEKHYVAGQQRLTFQRGDSGDDPGGVRQVVATIFDQVRDDIDTGLATGTIAPSRDTSDDTRMVVSRSVVALPATRAAEFREELLALVERFRDNEQQGDGTQPLFQLLIALHPTHNPPTPGDATP